MFSKYLSKELYKRDWTQREFAEKIEVCETLISKWINGDRTPKKLHHFQQIAKVFGTTIDEVSSKVKKVKNV